MTKYRIEIMHCDDQWHNADAFWGKWNGAFGYYSFENEDDAFRAAYVNYPDLPVQYIRIVRIEETTQCTAYLT